MLVWNQNLGKLGTLKREVYGIRPIDDNMFSPMARGLLNPVTHCQILVKYLDEFSWINIKRSELTEVRNV